MESWRGRGQHAVSWLATAWKAGQADGSELPPAAAVAPPAVTPEQVKSAAATLFGSENSVIAIVGDWAKVKDQLASYKDITFLDTEGKTIPPPQ